jgi:hypothetical protein
MWLWLHRIKSFLNINEISHKSLVGYEKRVVDNNPCLLRLSYQVLRPSFFGLLLDGLCRPTRGYLYRHLILRHLFNLQLLVRGDRLFGSDVTIFFLEEGAVLLESFEDHFGRGTFDME